MHTVSGKRVVWVVLGGIAVMTGLTVYWFMSHAGAVRRGTRTQLPTQDAPGEPAPASTPSGAVPAR